MIFLRSVVGPWGYSVNEMCQEKPADYPVSVRPSPALDGLQPCAP